MPRRIPRTKHIPLDPSPNDPNSPGWVSETVASVLGEKIILKAHPWSVNRTIYYSDKLIVRVCDWSEAAEDSAYREIESALSLGKELAQQPIIRETVKVDGYLLTLWHRVPGLVGKNTFEETRILTAMLRKLHAIPTDNFPPVPERMALAREWSIKATRYQEDIEKHLDAAEKLLAQIGPPPKLCVIHGDPHGGNAIFNMGRGTFIDLESAGVGDPHWDLAVVTRALMKTNRDSTAMLVSSWYDDEEIDVERIEVLSYVRSAFTLPVKASAPGLKYIDFTEDIARMNHTLTNLKR